MFIFQGYFTGPAVWFVYISNRVTSDISSSHPKTWNTALIITYRHFPSCENVPGKAGWIFTRSPAAYRQPPTAPHGPWQIKMRLSKLSQEGLTCDAQNPCNCWDEEYSEHSMFDKVWHTSIGAGFQPSTLWNKVIHIDNHYRSLVQIPFLQSKVQTCFFQTNHPKHCQSVLFRKFYALHRPVGDIPVLTLGTTGFICTDFRAKVPMSNEHQQVLDAFPLRTWGK